MKITSPTTLLMAWLGEKLDTDHEAKDRLYRAVYKYTSCGAWINFGRDDVRLGSIINGSDRLTKEQKLKYPFTALDFKHALDEVEREATDIWNDTHGCDKCGPVNEDTGYRAINKKCRSCKGQGVIL